MFRKKALDRLATPDDLDSLLVVVGWKSWIPTLACLLICGGGLAWALFGKIPVTVQGLGVLVNPGNVKAIQCISGGQLSELSVRVGQVVAEGDIIARIDQPEIRKQLEQASALLDDLIRFDRDAVVLEDTRDQLQRETVESERQFLTAEIKEARELAESIHDKSKEYNRTQRDNLTNAILVSKQLTTAFEQQYKDVASLRNTGASTRHELLAVEAELRERQMTLADYDVQLRQVDVSEIAADKDYQAQLNRISDLELRLRQVAIEFQESQQDLLEKRAARKREIQETQRRCDRLELELARQSEIRSQYEGRVLEVAVADGQVIADASRLATIEIDDDNGSLQHVAYFSISDGKRVQAGMPASITPATVKRERYGSIVGNVEVCSPFPVSREAVARSIGSQDLADQFVKDGGAIEIEAELERDFSSTSGYQWTSRGPNIKLSSGTTAAIEVTVEERAPITYLLPLLKTLFAGQAEA